MSPTPEENIEAFTGLIHIPLSVASRLIGESPTTLRKRVPLVVRGHRSKEVTIADLRKYVAGNKTTTVAKPNIIRITKP